MDAGVFGGISARRPFGGFFGRVAAKSVRSNASAEKSKILMQTRNKAQSSLKMFQNRREITAQALMAHSSASRSQLSSCIWFHSGSLLRLKELFWPIWRVAFFRACSGIAVVFRRYIR